MCEAENAQTLQRGMNFHYCPDYSLVLMSQRANAPYNDKVYPDGLTIEYEGHDLPRKSYNHNPKTEDQPLVLPSGKPTQNGLFVHAVDKLKQGKPPELVKVYEKVVPGVWSLKGYFDLVDYKTIRDGWRNVFKFILRFSKNQLTGFSNKQSVNMVHTRLIPTEVKKEVWKRDKGKCVICGLEQNLHFDHDLPFSKGGTSLTAKNVKLLCVKCNLAKSNKIE